LKTSYVSSYHPLAFFTFQEAEMSEESEDDSTPAAQLAKKTPEKHVKTKKLDQVSPSS
jgi:hypothetical protein